MGESEFLAAMEAALKPSLEVEGMQVVVDAVEKEATPEGSYLSVDFHLAGLGACTAQFTYTFSSRRTIEQNLANLSGFIRQHNPIASKPPWETRRPRAQTSAATD